MSFRIDWFDLLAVQGSVRLSLGKTRLNWSSVWQVGAMSILLSRNCIIRILSIEYFQLSLGHKKHKRWDLEVRHKSYSSQTLKVSVGTQAGTTPIVAQLCEGCSGLTDGCGRSQALRSSSRPGASLQVPAPRPGAGSVTPWSSAFSCRPLTWLKLKASSPGSACLFSLPPHIYLSFFDCLPCSWLQTQYQS